MYIKKTSIPGDMLIQHYLPAHYTDAFLCKFETDKQITPDDILVSFWTNPPGWVTSMMRLRDALVKPFGLKGGASEGSKEKFAEVIREGGTYRFVSVPEKSDFETVVCLVSNC